MAYKPKDIVDLLEREVARLDSSSEKTPFSEGQSYGHHASAVMVRAWRDGLVAELERLAVEARGGHYPSVIRLIKGE
jgi:hypothetical protein